MTFTYEIEGGNFSRAGSASSDIKKALKQLDLDYNIIKRVVVSIYEAEVNIVAHARRGTLTADIDADGIVVVLDDEGPGIPDIEAAMTTGFSTASPRVREMGFGAGMGLPNIKKNADSLHIQSTVGVGTRLEIAVNFK
ncbi:MAG: anti-sigma regulatory factor [Clostridia bacterium]|nr:anti-sigma regulatory factor [Clostridia bacterium]